MQKIKIFLFSLLMILPISAQADGEKSLHKARHYLECAITTQYLFEAGDETISQETLHGFVSSSYIHYTLSLGNEEMAMEEMTRDMTIITNNLNRESFLTRKGDWRLANEKIADCQDNRDLMS